MTAHVSERTAALHYEEQRLGIVVENLVNARYGKSAEVKRWVAEQLDMDLSTLYKRFKGEPGFSGGEIQLFADLIGEHVSLIYDGAGLLPSGAPLPRRAARKQRRAATLPGYGQQPAGYVVQLRGTSLPDRHTGHSDPIAA